MLVDKLRVVELGQESTFASNSHLLPVKLSDDTHTIMTWWDGGVPHTWTATTKEAWVAIAHSTEMPRAARGIGSDVVHIHGPMLGGVTS